MTLLANTRALNKLLQRADGKAVNFREMSEILRDAIQANIYVVSQKGKVLGYGVMDESDLHALEQTANDVRIPEEINQLLLSFDNTARNTDAGMQNQEGLNQISAFFSHSIVTVVPIIGRGERIGTIVLTSPKALFQDDDLVLAEFGSAIVGMEISRDLADEHEVETRNKSAVLSAVNSLTYSELDAVEHIVHELTGNEGLLVASKVADRAGITRSVIVNALRKLEGAGVIETRSLGMKGTYIKIINDQFISHITR
ncbi:GTP-sensing pleiotropic transcriptional regulator CodY [Paenibacillus guangzhouensis]|uniref:GTP-sensing pleiotropic transcriptional regulator CodY n=1 Tax=Paenibacillus guangzhouensis TaxID=1473112 RepID=UPI001266A7F8|nr:GTP-sensing pleiotropic transcriptional regulator CodY [Paenibacillus guangzhouensis]